MSSSASDPTAEFELIERIGKGQFGEVWKAKHRKTNKLLAIKKLQPGPAMNDIQREIAILKKCVSPWIVRYYGNCYHQGLLWIIMEYFSLGSLNDIMVVTGKTLTEPQVATVCKAMLEGLNFMQSLSKMHRDIKPHNVLLNQIGVSKLCDFGISSDVDSAKLRSTVIGTPYYLAPEVIKESGYDYKADIWSLGISAIEMAEKDPPYADLHPMRVLFVVANNPPPKLTQPEHWSLEFNDFINSCLELNPEKRPSASALLAHPFLKKANPSKLLPLIESAIEAIEKHGGLEKAVEAMRPKEEDDNHVDPDADMNDDMNGSGALFNLESPGSTVGTSLAIDSSDDEEDEDLLADFDSKSSDDSHEDDGDSIDIDDILGDSSDSDSKQKIKNIPEKVSSASKASKKPSKLSPPVSDSGAQKPKGTMQTTRLDLDFTDILANRSKGDDEDVPTMSARAKEPKVTPRQKKEDAAKLKIQMGANGQIFGAPSSARDAIFTPKGDQANMGSNSFSQFSQEIDWKAIEADSKAEEEAAKRIAEEKAIPSANPSGNTSTQSSTQLEQTPPQHPPKSSAPLDWSKVMAQVQQAAETKPTGRHTRAQSEAPQTAPSSSNQSQDSSSRITSQYKPSFRPGSASLSPVNPITAVTASTGHRKSVSSTGGYEDLLAELDVMKRRSGTPDIKDQLTPAVSITQFAIKAFEREFPLAVQLSKKSSWIGTSYDGQLPIRSIPQFVLSIQMATHALITLKQGLGSKGYYHDISFEVFQVRGIGNKFLELPAYGSVLKSLKATEKQLSAKPVLLDDSDSKYIIIPMVYDIPHGETVDFELEVKYSSDAAKATLEEVPNWNTKVVQGKWDEETAGGSNVFPTWRQNPQYHLKANKQCDLHLFLTQQTVYAEHIGFYIIRADDGRKVMRLPQSRLVNNDLKFRKRTEIYSGRIQLTPGSYVVIPATYDVGKIGSFTLSLLSSETSLTIELIPVPFCKTYEGKWDVETSGGCMNNKSWIKNPKYAISCSRRANLTFVLGLQSSAKEDDAPFIGFYLFKQYAANAALLTRKDLIARTKNFVDSREVVDSIQLESGDYILIPCTYTPGKIAPFTIQAHADHAIDQFFPIEEQETSIAAEWKGNTAGGSFSYPTWRLNPQFVLSSSRNESVIVTLEQEPKGTTADDLPFIAVALVKPGSVHTASSSTGNASSATVSTLLATQTKLFHLSPKEVIHLSQFSNVVRSVSIPVDVSPVAPLIVLPMVMQPSVENKFKIIVNSANAQFKRLPDELYVKSVDGQWNSAAGTAGGCLNNRDTWLQNPKYRFAIKKRSKIKIVLYQHPIEGAAQLPPGGFYVFKSQPGSSQLTKQDFIGKSDFASTKEVKAEYDLEVGIYALILTKFDPGKEGKFSLHLFCTHSEFAIGSMPQ